MTTFLLSRKRTIAEIRKNLIAYAFLLPALILYIVFLVKPMTGTIYISLHRWDGASANMVFVGLSNFAKALSDPIFWLSVYHNVIWTFIKLILSFSVGLVLAILIMEKIKLRTLFNGVYFIPVIPSLVVVGIVWGWLYNPRIGLVPKFLKTIGLGWLIQGGILGNSKLALTAVATASSWSSFGYLVAIFIAGLQGISPVLYDAAKVDGANHWQRAWHVTIPGLRPFTFKRDFDYLYIQKGICTELCRLWSSTGTCFDGYHLYF